MTNRRDFIKGSLTTGLFAASSGKILQSCSPSIKSKKLEEKLNESVLDLSEITAPVIIDKLDLFRKNGEYIVKVVSEDGDVGIALANRIRMYFSYPIMIEKVIPHFIGKDARAIENLVDDVYRNHSNYKYQGLPFWVCVAAVELSILDLLGKLTEKSIGQLFGNIVRTDVPVYRAFNNRGKPPEKSVRIIKRVLSEEQQFDAIKFKIGGRMEYNEKTMQRDRQLIPLLRKELGDQITIYSDANGSFDVPAAIEIGRILEDNQIAFFEEPCPFDHYDETKKIADKLTIRIAGGEVESSLWMFKWMLEKEAVQVVQPDLHYFGGMIRATKVARMAEECNIPITLHISGCSLGFVYMLHFAAVTPNLGEYQEFKDLNTKIPFECPTSTLKSKNGKIKVPTGPGFGIKIDPGIFKFAEKLSA